MGLRTRHAATSGRRRRLANDDGFSLIEVIVALGILMIVMLSTAGFFVQSLKTSSTQAQQQEAAQLATQQLDYTRSVPAKALLYGRTAAQVLVATNSPGITDLSQDVTTGFNYDGWDGNPSGQSSQVVPINMLPQTVSGTIYNVTTFIDRCYVLFGANQQCKATPTTNADGSAAAWLYRISVDVSWRPTGGKTCPTASKACQFVASTLRDPGTDPCFNVNVSFAGCSLSQPLITAFSPSTVTTNTSTNLSITGVNFDPGAKVTVDAAVGTISNVVVASTTTITFTLTTANTPAAVGSAQTIRVTNLNGKFALGTIAVTTSALNANSVSPTSVYAGATAAMVISGSGFQPGTLVSVPAVDGTIVGTPVVTATTISLNFLAGSTASALGPATYTVTNPDGATDTVSFTVVKAPITFTGISPSTQVYATNRTFVLTGTGFNSGAQVTLDAANVAEVVNSSTSITVSLTTDPSVATHTFLITNPDGGTASKTFAVTAGPTITSETPDPTTTATRSFTVNGSNFNVGITATITGVTGVTVSRTSSSLLTVTIPSSQTLTTGAKTLTVTNTDGGTASDPFTVVTPNIGGITPATSRKNTLTTFTITGTNFLGTAPTVTLKSGITATTTVTAYTSTSITFRFTTPTTVNNYSVGVQVTLADGTLSNVYTWALAVTN